MARERVSNPTTPAVSAGTSEGSQKEEQSGPPFQISKAGMIDEVLIVQRHDVVKIRRYGDAFLAHVVFSFYWSNCVFARAIVRMGLPRGHVCRHSAPDMHAMKAASQRSGAM